MDQTIIFHKSYNERLEKYIEILTDDIPAKQVMSEWNSYIESTVDQLGWQAIWKIPRQLCQEIDIFHPALALIYVDNINFEDLTVSVKVISVQNGIELPETLTACLHDLWPTEEQDETVILNLKGSIEALDNLRFFHKYLWRPWDEDSSEDNWFKKCLIPRMKLYYDLKQGAVTKKLHHYYKLQLTEAKEKYESLKKLENEDLESFENEIIDKLRDLHHLRKNLELFEHPILRERVFNKKCNKQSDISNLWIVLPTDVELSEYCEFIENVTAFTNSQSEFKTAKSLQEALDIASSNDSIYIGSGNHVVQSSGNLLEGGKIVNVDYPKEAIITTRNEYSLFNFKSGRIICQNIIFQLNTTQNGIRIQNGANLKFENCTIQGYKNKLISTQQGIIAETNSVIHFENCKFINLGTALTLDNCKAVLHNCEIKCVHFGIRSQNSAAFSIIDCSFSCIKCAVQIEAVDETTEEQRICGGKEILGSYSVPDVEIINTNIENKNAPEIIITNKLKFQPIRDILSNPAFNNTANSKTIIFDDDSE